MVDDQTAVTIFWSPNDDISKMGKHKKANNKHTVDLNGETMMESDAKSQDFSEQKREKENNSEYIRKSTKKKKKNKEKVTNELTNDYCQTNELGDKENDGENLSKFNEIKKYDILESKEINSLTLETTRISKKHKKKKRKSVDKCAEEIKDRSNESLHDDKTLKFGTNSKKRNRSEICVGESDEMTQSEHLKSGQMIGRDGHDLEKKEPEVQRKKHKRKKKRSKNNETLVMIGNGDIPEGERLGPKNRDSNEEKITSEMQVDNDDSKIYSLKSSHETKIEANGKKKKKRKHKDCEMKEEPCEVSLGKKMKHKDESKSGLDSSDYGIGISSNLNTNLNNTDNDVRLKKRKKKKTKVTEAETSNNGATNLVTHDNSIHENDKDFISETKHETKHKIETVTSTSVIKGQWDTNAFGDESKQNKFLRLLGGFKKGADTNSIHKKLFNVSDNKSPMETFPKRSSFGGSLAMDKTQQETYKKTMEAEYQSAVTSHLNRGLGLGFQKPEPKKTFTIDTQNSKSIKFEESD